MELQQRLILVASFFSSSDEKTKAMKWLLGLGGTWIILTLMVDLGETSDLAVALGLVIAGSVVLQYGPNVFQSLGVNTTITNPTTKSTDGS
jgi:hypothetical protein